MVSHNTYFWDLFMHKHIRILENTMICVDDSRLLDESLHTSITVTMTVNTEVLSQLLLSLPAFDFTYSLPHNVSVRKVVA